MTRSEVICRNSLGFWDQSEAIKMRDGVNQLSPFKFRVYRCECCTKYHLTARKESAKV